MQEKGIDLEKLSFCMFTAVMERRQVGKTECRDIGHADGRWVNNAKCPALLWTNFNEFWKTKGEICKGAPNSRTDLSC